MNLNTFEHYVSDGIKLSIIINVHHVGNYTITHICFILVLELLIRYS